MGRTAEVNESVCIEDVRQAVAEAGHSVEVRDNPSGRRTYMRNQRHDIRRAILSQRRHDTDSFGALRLCCGCQPTRSASKRQMPYNAKFRFASAYADDDCTFCNTTSSPLARRNRTWCSACSNGDVDRRLRSIPRSEPDRASDKSPVAVFVLLARTARASFVASDFAPCPRVVRVALCGQLRSIGKHAEGAREGGWREFSGCDQRIDFVDGE